MPTITKPPILDETGQAINTTLGSISLRSAVVDNCTTQDSTKALSANQGKILNDKLDSTCRRCMGELVFSSVPLNEAGLKLADGSYILRGAYTDFYDRIVEIYNSEDWTQSSSVTADYLVQPYSTWTSQKNDNGGPIGKYGYDSANNRVYLPDLRDAFVEGATSEELSKFMAAGIPNITGKFVQTSDMSGGYVSPVDYAGIGAISSIQESGAYGVLTNTGTDGLNRGFDFSAASGEIHNGSYRNDVYGKSDTVQPTSVKQYIYIVVANAYKSPLVLDIDEIMTEVNDIYDMISDLSFTVQLTDGTNTGTATALSGSQTTQIPLPSDIRANTFTATSARDKKDNISSSTIKALEIINKINVVDFTFKDDKEKNPRVGFIAEDTDPILSTPKQDSMDLYNCIGVLIKAVQELYALVKKG